MRRDLVAGAAEALAPDVPTHRVQLGNKDVFPALARQRRDPEADAACEITREKYVTSGRDRDIIVARYHDAHARVGQSSVDPDELLCMQNVACGVDRRDHEASRSRRRSWRE